jgi:hypothetical protein
LQCSHIMYHNSVVRQVMELQWQRMPARWTLATDSPGEGRARGRPILACESATVKEKESECG